MPCHMHGGMYSFVMAQMKFRALIVMVHMKFHASFVKLCRCCMALLQRASSFVTGSARCHGQLPIVHPAFASSRAWLADSCGMQKHAGFILNSVAKQLHGTRMATTRIHFGLCANVKFLIAVSRRELSGDLTCGAHRQRADFSDKVQTPPSACI